MDAAAQQHIIWCAIAISIAISIMSGLRPGDAPSLLYIIPVFFVAIGLYAAIGRFVYDALLRQRTYDGISNARVIVVTTLLGRRVRSLNLRTL